MLRAHRSIRLALVGLLVLAVLAPVAVSAAGGHFTDDDDSMFEADIEWMADSAITLGCNPPTNDNYCPDANVTRGQMAAFMHRLADNQVVDAGQLAGEDPAFYENMVWANDVEFGPLSTTLIQNGMTAAEMTIDVPLDGYLLINATASIYDPDDDMQSLWWIQVDDTVCFPNNNSLTSVGLAYASVYANERRQSASPTGAIAVTAGSHTVTLCGAAPPANNTLVYGPSLTVMFTGAGVVPTP